MEYDLIIIGAGPAGLTAGIYAARYKLKTIILTKSLGGTAATAHKVCNYPSYYEIKGIELMQNIISHVKQLEVPIITEGVKSINKKKDKFVIKTNKTEYFAKKVIFGAGTERTKLNVEGEAKFLGRGVSYCATCDAAFFKNKDVCVVGGSNAALTAALLLSEFGSKVYLIYRKSKFFRPEPAWIELVEKDKKIKVLFKEEIKEIKGEKMVEGVKLKSGKELKVEGVFIEVGSVAKTEILNDMKVKRDAKGYVITDKAQKTNVHGFFAAGDVTDNVLKQIVNSCGEGAVAAYSAYAELKKESLS
ncbi:MAG: FAD-dependent oxidoreductase [archaeon]